jgi:hypothetical protein
VVVVVEVVDVNQVYLINPVSQSDHIRRVPALRLSKAKLLGLPTAEL